MRSCSSARSVEGSAVTLANDCSIANATTCSANSGLPSDCWTKRRAAPGGGDASTSRPATSSSVCSGESGSSIASTPGPSGPAHDGPLLEQLGPRERDEHDRAVREGGEVLDEVEQPRLGPVQVVERDDERPVGRDPLEQPPERPLDLLARAAASARADRDRDAVGDLLAALDVGEARGEPRRRCRSPTRSRTTASSANTLVLSP